MMELEQNFKVDIEAVNKLSIVPIMLEIICRTTGMGFSAVARVTSDRWIACSVRDEIKFGMVPGSELPITSTICHEIHQTGESVVIDHVDEDDYYCLHHTPATYGFQSYFSIPIVLHDGTFFGTLCAIDPGPAVLSIPSIKGMFKVFAELISFHLSLDALLPAAATAVLHERIMPVLRQQLDVVLPKIDATAGSKTNYQNTIDRRSPEFAEKVQSATDKIRMLLNDLKAATLSL